MRYLAGPSPVSGLSFRDRCNLQLHCPRLSRSSPTPVRFVPLRRTTQHLPNRSRIIHPIPTQDKHCNLLLANEISTLQPTRQCYLPQTKPAFLCRGQFGKCLYKNLTGHLDLMAKYTKSNFVVSWHLGRHVALLSCVRNRKECRGVNTNPPALRKSTLLNNPIRFIMPIA